MIFWKIHYMSGQHSAGWSVGTLFYGSIPSIHLAIVIALWTSLSRCQGRQPRRDTLLVVRPYESQVPPHQVELVWHPAGMRRAQSDLRCSLTERSYVQEDALPELRYLQLVLTREEDALAAGRRKGAGHWIGEGVKKTMTVWIDYAQFGAVTIRLVFDHESAETTYTTAIGYYL